MIYLITDSSNPTEFQYGVPPPIHSDPGQGFYDFFPGQGPPIHGPDGLMPQFIGNTAGPHPGHGSTPGNAVVPGSEMYLT